jgi:hypothetical protein
MKAEANAGTEWIGTEPQGRWPLHQLWTRLSYKRYKIKRYILTIEINLYETASLHTETNAWIDQ